MRAELNTLYIHVPWLVELTETKGTFVWGYSSYSYSGLGITEYTEFQFRKERSWIWKRNTHEGGDLRTTMCASRERPRRISRQKFP